MEQKTETGFSKEIVKAMTKFGTLWQKSLDLRIQAAKLYFKAANEDIQVKFAFQQLPQFAHWSPAQWRVVFYVGAGSISTKYLDVHPYTISLVMLDQNICIEDQEKIFDEGLQVYVGSDMRTIPIKSLTAPHIEQAFEKDGSYRDEKAQKEYLKTSKDAKDRKNIGKLERISNGKWKARTSCIIDKAVVKSLLLSDQPMFTVAELQEILDALESRGE